MVGLSFATRGTEVAKRTNQQEVNNTEGIMSDEGERAKFAEIVKDIRLSVSGYEELEFLYLNRPECVDAERFREIAAEMELKGR